MREYEIWHDEYKWDDTVDEYWHGIFFIPIDKKKEIISFLIEIRNKHKIPVDRDVKFSWVLKDYNSSRAKIVKNNLDLFSHLLITKEKDAKTEIHFWNKKDKYEQNYNPFLVLEGLYWCKFVLLHIPDNHKEMSYYHMTYANRIETTFRLWFKGWSHLLFSDNEPIIIKKFYFDWHEHHSRNIDLLRITKWDFRNYCNICENCTIDDRGMKERDDESKIIVSFIDNIIGWWTAILKNKEDIWDILQSLKPIYDRLKEWKILKNKSSRWYKGINVSKLVIKNSEITFPNFFENTTQTSLFDL